MPLASFPNELLLEVYYNLGDLDDVLHLGRCCGLFHDLLEANRLRIMKRIIVQSDVHKHDVRLCHLISAIQAYAVHYETSAAPMPADRHDSSMFERCFAAPIDNPTDQQVWDIACRWQGLRLVQDLYLNSAIQSVYAKSAFPYDAHSYEPGIIQGLAEEGPLHIGAPVGPTVAFTSIQTQRFYKAITAHWLAIEAFNLLKTSNCPAQSVQNKLFDFLQQLWLNHSDRLLSESFDILEAHDFLYGFLVRSVFPSIDTFHTWVHPSGNLDFLIPYESPSNNWDYFVKSARLRLRPSDILELVLLKAGYPDAVWPPHNPTYLVQRGMFDRSGHAGLSDVGSTPDKWMSVHDLEIDAGLKLMAVDPALGDLWSQYRGAWATEARGTVFEWTGGDAEIIARVKGHAGVASGSRVGEIFRHITKQEMIRMLPSSVGS